MPFAPVFRRRSLRFAWLLAGGAWALALGVWASATAVQFDSGRIVQLAQARYGERGARTVSDWLETLEQARAQEVGRQLKVVNDFWNSNVRGVDDVVLWRKPDYWATPLETLGKRAGDCEDYVVGKYFSLLYLGVPPEKLRLIYVRASIGGQTIAHMVLGYYETPSSDPIVLDSLTSSMAPAGQRRDLTPVFSFNAQAVYVAGQERSVAGISRWQDLLARMRKEGIDP